MISELLIALVVAWIYITIVRFVDVNEREPLWALTTAFAAGVLAAGLAHALIDPVTRLTSLWGPFAEELLKFAALAATYAIFAGVARWRGWSEISDLVDGLVYGVAVGLGFSAGAALAHEWSTTTLSIKALGGSVERSILNMALSGLAHGIFAAVSGFGLAAAVLQTHWLKRVLFALAGLLAAMTLNYAFGELAHGNALAEQVALARTFIALGLPLVVLVAVGLYLLSTERRAIVAQLRAESEAGLVSPNDLGLVGSVWRRQLTYIALLARGRLAECLRVAGTHNRQVQLALAKQREAREPNSAERERLAQQVHVLRASLRSLRGAVPLLIFCLTVLLGGTIAYARSQVVLNAGAQRVVNAATPQLHGYWRTKLGGAFREIRAISEYPLFDPVCGFVANNAMYCKPNQSIYYDMNFVNQLHDTIGDMAPVILLAHEYGHRVQDLRGLMEPSSGLWGIQLELQADCLAGEWTREMQKQGRVDPGDRAEALDVLNGGRDKWDYPWYAKYAHGTGGQRVDAFQHGFDGNICDGDVFWRRVRLDPAASQQRITPKTGSLISTTAKKKGRFDLVDIKVEPTLLGLEVPDGILAKFRAADGTEVTLIRMAFVSADAAARRLESATKYYADSMAYITSKEGPVKDGEQEVGKWRLMTSITAEIVLHRNAHMLEIIGAAHGIAWEFATANVEKK